MDALFSPDLIPLPSAEPLDRRTGIGASMAPVVCNLVPWSGLISNPLGAYLWYTGAIERQPATEEMLLGDELEAGIRKALARRLGKAIVKPETRRHQVHSWIYASPDGLVSPREGAETKNVGAAHAGDWGEEGTDEVPDYVNVQCQQQMEVFDLDIVHVGALLWGNSFRVYHVERSPDLWAALFPILGGFWDRLEHRDPPEPDWTHPATPRLVELLHQPRPEETVQLDQWAQLLAEDYELRGRTLRELEKQRAEVKARLALAMGSAGRGLLPDGRQITRKEVHVPARTQEGYSYFDLRIPKARQK